MAVKRPVAELITIGSEVLNGCVLNTNAQYLGCRLTDLGFEVRAQSACPDTIAAICASLELAMRRADLIFLSGGLGPTPDDVTRDAAAEFFKEPLVFSKQQFRLIRLHYRRFGSSVPEIVKREACFPKSAIPLLNHYGIALGFCLKKHSRVLIVLPGVPSELEKMFEGAVVPLLKREFKIRKKPSLVVRIAGLSEPEIMRRLKKDFFEEPFDFGIYPMAGEVTLRLKAERGAMLSRLRAKIKKRIGDFVYAYEDRGLAETVGGLLSKRRKTLAVAESCTGGQLASAITDVPGASRYFLGGVVAYDNGVKIRDLGVGRGLIKKRGAVSEEVALAMARGVSQKIGSSYGIGITGIAGPAGGGKKKPVGLVMIGLSGPRVSRTWRHEFWGRRSEVQEKAVKKALQYLWRELR